ncbi:unnamed protein product [Somion occarium]|uniref:Uncharacterized protein n=1 Tax=Somion occarium TaxID=3059160 RepID=A0ABP1E5P4_9APHY
MCLPNGSRERVVLEADDGERRAHWSDVLMKVLISVNAFIEPESSAKATAACTGVTDCEGAHCSALICSLWEGARQNGHCDSL